MKKKSKLKPEHRVHIKQAKTVVFLYSQGLAAEEFQAAMTYFSGLSSKPNNSWEHRTGATQVVKMSKLSIQVSLGLPTQSKLGAVWGDVRARFKLLLEQVIAKVKIPEELKPNLPGFERLCSHQSERDAYKTDTRPGFS